MNLFFSKILFSLRIIPLLFLAAAFFLGLRLTLLFLGFQQGDPFMGKTVFAEVQKQEEKKPTEEKPAEAKTPEKKEAETKPKEENKPTDSKPSEETKPDEGEQATENTEAVAIDPENLLDDSSFSPQKIDLLNKLRKRQEEIEQARQLALSKNDVMQALEKKLDDKFVQLEAKKAELEKMKTDLAGIRKIAQDVEDKKIFSLVKIYETMKPKEAARILEQLDPNVALQIFRNMNAGKIAPILASMTPEKAKTMTMYLAENKPLPKEVE